MFTGGQFRRHQRLDGLYVPMNADTGSPDSKSMKTQIDADDLAHINRRLAIVTACLGSDLDAGQHAAVEYFLDNEFSPPLRPGWREAWSQNQRMRQWMGSEAWMGDVHSGYFMDGPLDDGQWEYLHRVAVALIRIGWQTADVPGKFFVEAQHAISDYLEAVGFNPEVVEDVTSENQ